MMIKKSNEHDYDEDKDQIEESKRSKLRKEHLQTSATIGPLWL